MRNLIIFCLIFSSLNVKSQKFKLYANNTYTGIADCGFYCNMCVSINQNCNIFDVIDSALLDTVPKFYHTVYESLSWVYPCYLYSCQVCSIVEYFGCNDSIILTSNYCQETNEISIKPIITLSSNLSNFSINNCSRDTVKLIADSGFEPNKYKWEYRLSGSGSNGWISLPNNFITNNNHSVSFTLEGIFGSNYINFLAKPLDFRINLDNCYNTLFPNSYINNITFFKATPRVQEFQEIKPLCSYNPNGGGAKLRFNRSLSSTEHITFDLIKREVTGNSSYNMFINNYNIVQANLDATNSYKILGLSAGNYFILIEGKDGIYDLCSKDTFFFSITLPSPITFNANSVDLNCFNDNSGSITIQAQGGTPPYLYKVDGVNWSSNNTFNQLSAGNHQYIVKDSKECFSIQDSNAAFKSISISQPDLLQLKLNDLRNPLGFGRSDGFLKVNALGGTAPYYFNWSNGFIGSDNLNLADGFYTVTLTDFHGCSQSESFKLIAPDPLVADIDTLYPVLCHGDKNGSLIVKATGGVRPYSYIWTTDNIDSVIDGVPAGNYSVIITDKNQNTTTASITLGEPDTLKIVEVLTPAKCADTPTGAIDITPSGGVKPYQYQWIYGDTTEDLHNIAAGKYFITLQDYYGCRFEKSITLTSPESIESKISGVSPTCFNGSDGHIQVEATGGSLPYTYQWSSNSTNQPKIENLTAGTYTSTVTDANNCSYINLFTLTNPEKISIDIPKDVYVLCQNQKLNLNGESYSSPNVNYDWSSNYGYKNTNPQVELSDSGEYTVSITNKVGCKNSDNFKIIRSKDKIDANFFITSKGYNDESIVVVNGGLEYDSIRWNIPPIAEILVANNDLCEFNLKTNGLYNVGITAIRGECTANYEKPISIIDRPLLYRQDSVKYNTLISKLNVYPIPTSNIVYVNVELYEKADFYVRLYNLLSNLKVYDNKQDNKSIYEFSIDLTNSPTGVYLLLLETKKDKKIIRVMKQ